MKNFKAIMLATLTFMHVSAKAGNDPVVDQINITRDAVNVALEEFAQGRTEDPTSEDAKVKLAIFNAEASRALNKFEENVRVRVLQSFSVLISQYNNTYKNKTLGVAKDEILSNMLVQILELAKDKSQVYKEAYLELYSILPDMPIQYDYQPRQSWPSESIVLDYVEKKKNLFSSEYDRTFNYAGDFYLSKSKTRKVTASSFNTYYYNNTAGVQALAEKTGLARKDEMKMKMLEGCYSATCYFLTQSQFTVWTAMIESSLVRDIVLKLQDGRQIIISKNVNRNGKIINLVNAYLSGIVTEGLINNLPLEISDKRFAILSKMNTSIEKNNCGAAKKTAIDLCQQTQEGCLVAGEVALLKERHGNKAKCL